MARARRRGSTEQAAVRAAATPTPWRLLPALLGLTLFIQPLLLDLHSTDEYETPKLIFLRCAGALLVAAWLWDARRQGVAKPWAWRLLPVAAFLGVAALSTLTAAAPSTSLLGEYGSYAGLQTQFFYLLVALAAYALPTLGDLRRALLFVVLGALPSTGMALLEAGGHEIGTLFGMTAEIPAHQTSGFFGNPNYFAGYTVSLLPLCVYFMRDRRRWVQIAAAIAGLASGVAVVMSGSRTGILFLFLVLVWLVLHVWLIVRAPTDATTTAAPLSPSLRRGIWIATAAAVLILLTGAVLAGPQLQRVGRSLTRPLRSIAKDRLDLWQAGLALAAQHPLLGAGPDSYAVEAPQHYAPSVYRRLGGNVSARRAHNEAINVLACMGGLGFVAWLWLIWGSVGRGVQLVRRDDDDERRELAMALVACLSAGVGFNLLHFITIGQGPWQYAVVGALLALDRLRHAEPADWRVGAMVQRIGVAGAVLASVLLARDGVQWIRAEHHLKNSYVASLRNQLLRARDEVDQAVVLRPGERRYLEAQAQLRLRTARSADEVNQARQSIQAALDISRAPLGLWILLAIEKRAEDVDAVQRVARDAVARDPTRPGELDAAVRWLLGRGHIEPALELLELALPADPDAVGSVAIELATILEQRGRTPSALSTQMTEGARALAGIAHKVPTTAARAAALLEEIARR
ncbi:MAG: O-antigen ligase family protein [Pseudomonadota bacterium]